MHSGLSIPLKHKLTLLDKIVDKKEQFKDEHLKKLVQSDKYSIRRLVKNIQRKIQERKDQEQVLVNETSMGNQEKEEPEKEVPESPNKIETEIICRLALDSSRTHEKNPARSQIKKAKTIPDHPRENHRRHGGFEIKTA